MKRRIDIGFVLVSYFYACTAFYLPGLAPVSFCEEAKAGGDCQVRISQTYEFVLNHYIYVESSFWKSHSDFNLLAGQISPASLPVGAG